MDGGHEAWPSPDGLAPTFRPPMASPLLPVVPMILILEHPVAMDFAYCIRVRVHLNDLNPSPGMILEAFARHTQDEYLDSLLNTEMLADHFERTTEVHAVDDSYEFNVLSNETFPIRSGEEYQLCFLCLVVNPERPSCPRFAAVGGFVMFSDLLKGCNVEMEMYADRSMKSVVGRAVVQFCVDSSVLES